MTWDAIPFRNTFPLLFWAATLLGAASPPAPNYGKLPLAFEENRGQADTAVRFLARTGRYTLQFSPSGATLTESGATPIAMSLDGANPSPRLTGVEQLPGTIHYFVGERSQWKTNIPSFRSVRYSAVYPGIDLVFHGNERRLEYDFVIEPNADPRQIRLSFSGIRRLGLDAQGNLELATAHGILKQYKPVVFQIVAGHRREVEGRYVPIAPDQVRFEVAKYDRSTPLVIDPVVAYSTYFGGANDDRANAVAADSNGAAYIAGKTAGAVSYGFVSKLNPAGTATSYTAYLGDGKCNAAVNGIAVDTAGNAYVTGLYGRQDQWGYCTQKHVLGAKLDQEGKFGYYFYYGKGDDYGNAVAVDTAGKAYITGLTHGDFPVTNGSQGGFPGDVFILQLNAAGQILYATYLGGGLIDEGLAIAVDAAGYVYVAGSTGSGDFPTTQNAYQQHSGSGFVGAFVSKVDIHKNQLVYSTYLAGYNGEAAHGVAVDKAGMIYVVGNTDSDDFPRTANAYDQTCGSDGLCNAVLDYPHNHYSEDVFFAKIDPHASGPASLLYCTFLGGLNRDLGQAVAVNAAGHAIITGRTGSSYDFPLVGATQRTLRGDYDAFVAEIDPSKWGAASLIFSTYLGGRGYDEATGVALDPHGNIYVAGVTNSTDFPTLQAFQGTNGGGNEGFIAKFGSSAPLALSSIGVNPAAVRGGVSSGGTVGLTKAAGPAGITIALSTDNAAAVVPPSVTIPAGGTNATFTITTKMVTANTQASIRASYGGVTKAATLTISRIPTALVSVAVTPPATVGGAALAGVVTVSPAPASPLFIALSSSNPNAATVPANVLVPGGGTSAMFKVTTKPVSASAGVAISANYAGITKTVLITVNRPSLSVLMVAPVAVVGGTKATGAVTLSGAAPPGGVTVALTSNHPNAAAVPVNVHVTAGAKTASFPVATKAAAVLTQVTITANYGGANRSATLAVKPPALSSLTIAPASVTGPASATGTVILSGPAPAGNFAVNLISNKPGAATVPAILAVAAGAKAATFTVSTKNVTAKTNVTITASAKNITKAAVLTIQ